MSSGNYLNNKAEIDKKHKVVCAGRDELRDLIADEEILDYAEKNHLIIVFIYMNINFKRLLYAPLGQIIISMLLGFGLATLFRKACNKRNCLIFRAAPLSKIKGQIFKYDDKCYKFNPKSESCTNVKKSVEFA